MFSFLDIWFIKKELNPLLNSRFEKLFKGENFLIFQFSKNKKFFLKYIFGKSIFLADKEKNREFFIQKNEKDKELEKLIERMILKDIKIYPGERVMDFIFEGFNKKKILRFQIFGKGNIWVYDENQEVFNYNNLNIELTKNIPISIFENKELFEKIFRESNLGEDKFLMNYLGFGKYYYNEFKARFEFSFENVIKFLNLPIEAVLTEKRPFPIKTLTLKIIKPYSSFSEALDDFFRPKSKYEKMIEDFEKNIENLKEKIAELEKEAKKYEDLGNLIYNYYSFFDELIKNYNKFKKEGKLEEFYKKLEKLGFKKEKDCITIEEENIKRLLKDLFGY